MKLLKKSALATVGVLAISAAASAAMPSSSDYWYAGLDGTFLNIDYGSDNGIQVNDYVPHTHEGLDFYVGRHFTKLLALEAGAFKTNKKDKTHAGVTADQTLTAMHLDVVANLPLEDKISVLAVFGYNWMHSDVDLRAGSLVFGDADGSKSGGKMGFGLRYDLSKSWSIRGLAHRMFIKDYDHAWQYNAGLQYRF